MKMNDDKQQQSDEELFDLLIKQAARQYADEETHKAIEMCENTPPFVTTPDFDTRIANILACAPPKTKRSFKFKAVISVAVVAVVLLVLLATPVAADFRVYINQLIFGNAPTHSNVATMVYYDDYRAALIESGLERIYVPTHSRIRKIKPTISIEAVKNHTLIAMSYNAGDSQFIVNQTYPTHDIQSYDIERSGIEQILIDGEAAYLWESSGRYYVFYSHGDYYIDIITDVSAEAAIEIAKSLSTLTLEEV